MAFITREVGLPRLARQALSIATIFFASVTIIQDAEAAQKKQQARIAAAYGNQDLWRRESEKGITGALHMLRAERSFAQILQFLQDKRHAIAIANTPDEASFYAPRLTWKEEFYRDEARGPQEEKGNAKLYIDGLIDEHGEHGAELVMTSKTPLVGRYLASGQMAQKLMRANIKDKKNFKPAKIPTRFIRHPQISFIDENLLGYASIGRIGKKTLELTYTLFSKQPDEQTEAIGMWIHTNPAHIPTIIEHVGRIHQSLMAIPNKSSATQQKQIMELLGGATWWMSHAMPTGRGSAGVTEWYVSAVLRHFAITKQRKPDLSLDQIAFHTSEDVFRAQYESYFE